MTMKIKHGQKTTGVRFKMLASIDKALNFFQEIGQGGWGWEGGGG